MRNNEEDFLILSLKKCQYDTALRIENKNKVFTALQRKKKEVIKIISSIFTIFFWQAFDLVSTEWLYANRTGPLSAKSAASLETKPKTSLGKLSRTNPHNSQKVDPPSPIQPK